MTTPARAAEHHAAPPPPTAGTVVTDPSDPFCETCRKPLTDGLTGVLDRRAWDTRAARAVAAARQCGRPLALVLVDLDRFKAVNDTYGHLAGDAVLRAVAGVLGRAKGALVGRYGGHAGDEFLMLLPGATVEDAAAVARDAQRRIALLSVAARSSRSTTVAISGQTVSMGIAGCVPTGSDQGTLSDLLLDSDVALRAAKQGGRDRVCTADALPADPVGTAAVQLPRQLGRPSTRPRTEGEVRIPLDRYGPGAGGSPTELVLSPDAAEHLHAVLTELLGRTCTPAP